MRERPCQACNQQIKWIPARGGKSMPVDLPPRVLIVGDGPDAGYTVSGLNYVRGTFIERGKEGEILQAIQDGGGAVDTHAGGRRICHVYVSHFKTCTDPGRFSRKGGQGDKEKGRQGDVS